MKISLSNNNLEDPCQDPTLVTGHRHFIQIYKI